MGDYPSINMTVDSVTAEIQDMSTEDIVNIIVNLRCRVKESSKVINDLRLVIAESEKDEVLENTAREDLIKSNYNIALLQGNVKTQELEISRLKRVLKGKEQELKQVKENVKETVKEVVKEVEKVDEDGVKYSVKVKELEEKIKELRSNIVELEATSKDQEELMGYVADKWSSAIEEVELLKQKEASRKPPKRYHKKGTDEFYRDILECYDLVEIKIDKNGKKRESWLKAMEELKKKDTVMNYIEGYGVQLTRDNVKRWVKVALNDPTINTKEYDKNKGYKR